MSWVVGSSSRSHFQRRQQANDSNRESFTRFFLVACTRLYKSPCPSVDRSVGLSVGPSVRRSVTLCFFYIFGHFKGWKVCIWACPCPNHYCPCPNHYYPCLNHYCPCQNHYCTCPTVRDRSSRVYGLVSCLFSYLILILLSFLILVLLSFMPVFLPPYFSYCKFSFLPVFLPAFFPAPFSIKSKSEMPLPKS